MSTPLSFNSKMNVMYGCILYMYLKSCTFYRTVSPWHVFKSAIHISPTGQGSGVGVVCSCVVVGGLVVTLKVVACLLVVAGIVVCIVVGGGDVGLSARRVILNSRQNCSTVVSPAADTLHLTVKRMSLSSMAPQVNRSSTC